jgi:hypothetical protein
MAGVDQIGSGDVYLVDGNGRKWHGRIIDVDAPKAIGAGVSSYTATVSFVYQDNPLSIPQYIRRRRLRKQ